MTKWRKIARRLVFKRQKKSKSAYDLHLKPNPQYELGDLVLVASKPRCNGKTKKFLFKFVGPYQVCQRVSSTCYKVEDLPAHRKKRIWRRFNVHVSQLRRYFPRRELDWQPDEGSSTDNDSLSGNEQQIRTEDDKNANQSEFENDLETSTSDTEFEEDEEIRTRTGPVTTRTGRQSRQPERFVAGVRR